MRFKPKIIFKIVWIILISLVILGMIAVSFSAFLL